MRLSSLAFVLGLFLSQLSAQTASADWQTVTSSILDMNLLAGATAAPDGTLYALGFTFLSQQPVTWVLGSSADQGKTWQQLDRYLYSDKTFSEPAAVYLSKAGDLYETGYVQVPGTYHWIIRERQKDGSFAVVLERDIGESGFCMGPTGIAENDAGQIAVVGCAKIPEQPSTATLIMTSSDRGVTWSNSEIPGPPSSVPFSHQGGCRGTALSFQGNNLVVAQACGDVSGGASPFGFWTEVSLTSDGGKTWQLVDRGENQGFGVGPQISSLATTSSQDIFYGGNFPRDWRIRQFSHTFSTWGTVDELMGSGNYTSEMNSIFVDPVTNQIWASGSVDNNGGIWTTRTSTNGGETWTNSDQFQDGGTHLSEGGSIVQIPKGPLFIFGQISRNSITVRMLAP